MCSIRQSTKDSMLYHLNRIRLSYAFFTEDDNDGSVMSCPISFLVDIDIDTKLTWFGLHTVSKSTSMTMSREKVEFWIDRLD